MKDADDFNTIRTHLIKDCVAMMRETPNPRRQLLPLAPDAGMTADSAHRLIEFFNKAICIFDAIIRDIIPDFDWVQRCAWSDEQASRLFGPS